MNGGDPGAAGVWPPVPGLPDLAKGDRVHLVGVGGAGMSGLARALIELGLVVSGSDRQASPLLAALAAEGVEIRVGHAAEQLPPGCALVLRSPAVPDENPELVAARAAGIPVSKRAPLLGALMDARTGIAVAGTHGKTTTSGLIAFALESAGLAPSFFVGGELPDLGSNARLGNGVHLVLEADEYDRSFLHGHPVYGIITSLEHDHPDIYPDTTSLVEAFADFAARVEAAPRGWLLVNAAWPLALQAASTARARVELYHVEGDPAPAMDRSIAWRACGLESGPDGTHFELLHLDVSLGRWHLALPGRHNLGNAVAALALAETLGLDREGMREALRRYRGAGRRFEQLGSVGGITLIDDYAHHPTEIVATLAAARERYAGRRLLAIVEPHTYSRVALLVEAFREALGWADHSLVCPIYAAREAPLPGIDSVSLCAGLSNVEAVASLEAAADRAAELAGAGDVLLFMGAGAITQASRRCLVQLRGRAVAELLAAAAAEGLGGEAQRGGSLAEQTTLRVGGPADLLVRVRQADDLIGWWRLAHAQGLPVRVLGRGSNVLVADAGLPGLVLVNRCEAWQLEATEGETGLVRAESGLTLAALAQQLARLGWCGFEMGVGIPGSVGAAVVTNAGAHGWEMVDSLVSVDLVDAEGKRETVVPEQLALRYRGSVLKDQANRLLVSVTLRLRRDEPEAILARIADFARQRRRTQPRDPSVGSVFKNPPADFAGRLIEAAGLKGQRIGGAEISAVHANFVVNVGGASAADVRQLIETARRTVERQAGLRLETEIEQLGGSDVH